MFRDREDAGIQLAEKLSKYRGENAVVVALPRGGVILGEKIARGLELPLDICAIRKVGRPHDPEYALCAVDEDGMMLCDEEAASIDPSWLAKEKQKEEKEAKRRARLYRNGRAALLLEGKTVILVDDGIATGLTMRLAVSVLKKQKPKQVIVAVPVAPEDSVQTLRKEADEVIVLEPPTEFLGAVGAHYTRFEQVSDAEVIELLKKTVV